MREIRLQLDQKKITYYLERKLVKNINLRIKKDGKVFVSAHFSIPLEAINNFIIKKTDWIDRHIKTILETKEIVYPEIENIKETKSVLVQIFNETCSKYNNVFGENFQLKFRKMKTRWGTFNSKDNSVTLNLYLIFKPQICVEYVVLHELCHSKYLGHGSNFCSALQSLMPDWKVRRMLLNKSFNC